VAPFDSQGGDQWVDTAVAKLGRCYADLTVHEMHAGRHYSLKEVSAWTRRETFVFVIIGTIPTVLFEVGGWKFLAISWLPIALVGTAVAFITGFKNNASYGRLWEARQIWGGIINTSRTFGILLQDFVADPESRRRLTYRHFAWLTALRHQLREPRTWENMKKAHNAEYQRRYTVSEWVTRIEDELTPLLPDPDELAYVLARKNRATHLMAIQSVDPRKNAEPGYVGELRHIELERLLAAFVEAQGRCERIKNFPYPRQFATLNLFFVWLFIVLMPLGLLQEFHKLGPGCGWLTIPASVIIAWVFHTMDKIGEISENPFEGSPNDVPITAMSRTIEIDMREMLGETDLPPALQPVNNILL
jgi:ion channel-forming bestrophin family protein